MTEHDTASTQNALDALNGRKGPRFGRRVVALGIANAVVLVAAVAGIATKGSAPVAAPTPLGSFAGLAKPGIGARVSMTMR